MSKIFSFKYLAILVLTVAAVVGVGNAAALTLTSATGQNVVEGSSNAFVADSGAVAYTIDNNGDVTASVTGLTDSYDSAKGSLTGASGSFVACTTGASSITCVFPNTTLNAGTKLYLVATADN